MNAIAGSPNQRGAAIVLAMGIAALAAIAATAILVSQSTRVRESEMAANYAQAHALVQAGVDWGRAVLSDDRRSSNVDYTGEPWALKLAPVPVEQGELAGDIEDQQGLFNLNNLVKDGKTVPAQLAHYRALLAILALPTDLANTLADWMDADNGPPDGAGKSSSLTVQSTYLPANRPLTDVSELALVPGYDEVVRARLRRFVTALPRETALNVNTAPAEVLAAVIDGLGLDRARGLAAQRKQAYFRDSADFRNRLPRDLAPPTDGISVTSSYFLITARATIGLSEATGQALLFRENSSWPIVVWRKLP